MTKRSASLAMDRALVGFDTVGMDRAVMAFDRESVRAKNEDGHLQVARTHISKAAVNPYRGAEIPHNRDLGLDPDRVYKLYRDPEELKKAAHTFNRLPLLSEHSPINADSHDHGIVVGSTGESATYEHPYLDNGLVIWTRGAIDAVESGDQRELSAAYRYRADMTPGEVDGEPYDGVMRDIRGSHVAIVKKGRAGSDVVVGDSALQPTLKETFPMSKIVLKGASLVALGALMATLRPVMAMDAKVDLPKLLGKVDHTKFSASKAALVAGVRKAIDGKLAQDTDLDEAIAGVTTILDAIGEKEVADVVDAVADPADGSPPGGSADAGLPPAAIDFLSGILSEEQVAQLMEIVGTSDGNAVDESPEAKEKREKEDADKKEKDGKAMDEAIKAATAALEIKMLGDARELREATEAVRPYVGSVPLALDSAEGVYRHALSALGVAEAKTLPAAALKPVLKAQPIPGTGKQQHRREASHAMDSSAAKGFFGRFPGAEKIGV